ncbi:hypothetical protein HMPREF1981_02996 [Bacteroides pyogenes F0041]|uniref:Uncharacterized protein n=1 Tax=Bacteroides pyogenes F0041 TaxID=1321819 RepID=U2DJC5_9BACE|nr:hypothetical protein HMPREF1981_02996 [Bacteroides pyogenes F0041]
MKSGMPYHSCFGTTMSSDYTLTHGTAAQHIKYSLHRNQKPLPLILNFRYKKGTSSHENGQWKNATPKEPIKTTITLIINNVTNHTNKELNKKTVI